MKLNKFIKIAAAVTVAAAVFAGCKFTGTTASFKEDERNLFTAVGDESNPNDPEELANSAQVESWVFPQFGGSTVDKASKKTIFYVTIVSLGKLDEKSIEAAMDLYPLTGNTVDRNFAPVRGTAFPKKVKLISTDVEVYDPNDPSNTTYYGTINAVWTGVEFEVDLSTVENSKIAFVVDATKLKEKTGRLVMNGDGNNKCGEESDSYIRYFNVTKKADDSVTTAIDPWYYSEKFNPVWNFPDSDSGPETDSEGKPTGAIKFEFEAPRYSKYDGSYLYIEDLAADLSKFIILRTLPIGASKWTETPVTFTYNSTDHKYEGKTAVIQYGTKYDLLVDKGASNGIEAKAAKDVFGHTPKNDYDKGKKLLEFGMSGSVPYWKYLTDEPGWILDTPDNSESATAQDYVAGSVDLDDFYSAQRSVLDWYQLDNYRVMIYLDDDDLHFNTYDDFKITDSKGNILKTKAPQVYDEDDDGEGEDGVQRIILELENKNYKLDLNRVNGNCNNLFVGEKVTIKGNKAHPNQLKFGTPKIEQEDTLTGYTLINP